MSSTGEEEGAMSTTDPTLAEADHPEPPRLTPRTLHRAAVDSGGLGPTATGLVFLVFVIVPAWIDRSVPIAVAVTALALIFALQYLYIAGIRFFSLRTRLLWLAGIWLNIGLLGALIGADVVYMVMYLVLAHAVVLPWRGGRIAVLVLGLAGVACALALGQLFAVFLAVAGMIFGLYLGYGIQRSELENRAERAERRSAVLAVAAERERIGRDLHDILGHSLTTITVSAQLAQRLVATDPSAAGDQLREIERISRQALADVRATTSGLREVRVATEIASARSVLEAAGIAAQVPTALPALDDARAELFGYAVREGVTNVVRHSRARTCGIEIAEDEVRVIDDGRGIPRGSGRTGLAGLAARFEEAGGALAVTSSAEGTRLLGRLGAEQAQEGRG